MQRMPAYLGPFVLAQMLHHRVARLQPSRGALSSAPDIARQLCSAIGASLPILLGLLNTIDDALVREDAAFEGRELVDQVERVELRRAVDMLAQVVDHAAGQLARFRAEQHDVQALLQALARQVEVDQAYPHRVVRVQVWVLETRRHVQAEILVRWHHVLADAHEPALVARADLSRQQTAAPRRQRRASFSTLRIAWSAGLRASRMG